ncbi:MAG: hypothetical protein NTY19_24040 [Planctomycetota bacterium]|nr:hypothetical protein [Planctomycetota bacterium]
MRKDKAVSVHQQTVVNYFMDQIWEGENRPFRIVVALCELFFPGRKFEINTDGGRDASLVNEEDCHLCTLLSAFDVDTGECAADLWCDVTGAEPSFLDHGLAVA